MGIVPSAHRNPDRPLDKIFGSIPAESSDFTHASVRHYILWSFLLDTQLRFPYIQPNQKRLLIISLRGVNMNVREMFDLNNKVAIVTGGGRGIGLKMAEGLAEVGANIVLCSRKVENCHKAAQNLAKLGVKTLAMACDVRSLASIQSLVDKTLEEFGRLDILVNNSGVTWGASPEDHPLEGWEKVMATNMTGAFLFSQTAGRAMIRQKSGSIINIASVMGIIGTESDAADAIAYSASKGALITFTKDLAVKWAKYNIRVNAIAPGWFPTDMTNWTLDHHGRKLLSHIPMGRFGEAEELKGAVVYLASEASRYVTGIVLPVDGGLLAV
jgi:gluconate 5-dehydrogenase